MPIQISTDNDYLQFRRRSLLEQAQSLMARFMSTGNRMARRSLERRYEDAITEIVRINQRLGEPSRSATIDLGGGFNAIYDEASTLPTSSWQSLQDLVREASTTSGITVTPTVQMRYPNEENRYQSRAYASIHGPADDRCAGLEREVTTAPKLTEYAHQTQIQQGKDFSYKMELYTVN